MMLVMPAMNRYMIIASKQLNNKNHLKIFIKKLSKIKQNEQINKKFKESVSINPRVLQLD